jgi:lysophospholipase L1-like esterase
MAAMLASATVVILKADSAAERRVSNAIDRLTNEVILNSPADLGNDHVSVRSFMIRSQLAQTKHPIVLMGDSITEGALVQSSVCGHTIVNAGIGGMTIGSYLPFAKTFLAGENAEMIVVELGANDSIIPAQNPLAVEAAYSQLVDFLAQHTEKLILSGLVPFDMSGGLAKKYFDEPSSELTDIAVRKIARTRKLSFIDLRNDIRGDHLTVDGIHLNADGYDKWHTAVLGQIRSSLSCATD